MVPWKAENLRRGKERQTKPGKGFGESLTLGFQCVFKGVRLPETKILHLKISHFSFQPLIFRGELLVSLIVVLTTERNNSMWKTERESRGY